MTRDPFTDAVRQFHEICELPLDEPVTNGELVENRIAILAEEVRELSEAVRLAQQQPTTANRAALLRELADVQYVLAGFAVSFGLPLADGFARVHEANLSKLVDGRALKAANGKVIKGPNFKPPYVDDLVA